MSERRITEAKIEIARSFIDSINWGGSGRVMARFNGADEWLQVVSYYHDEITFSPEEVIGLTLGEVTKLYHEKDVRYLQS